MLQTLGSGLQGSRLRAPGSGLWVPGFGDCLGQGSGSPRVSSQSTVNRTILKKLFNSVVSLIVFIRNISYSFILKSSHVIKFTLKISVLSSYCKILVVF